MTNIYMPDYDYIREKISFRTVFYRTAYAYCICACAFEHEYLNYLSDKGSIDEIVFERVINNVLNGECEHVKNVPKHYIKETYVYGIHIAAAVGTIRALKKHVSFQLMEWLLDDRQPILCGGVYRLSPAANAALNGNYKSLRVYCNQSIFNIFSGSYRYARRTGQNVCEITLENVTHLELAVIKQNFKLVETILQSGLKFATECIISALKIAFSYSELPIQQLLINYIRGLVEKGEHFDARLCAETIIVFNKPKFLKQIINSINVKHPNEATSNDWLGDMCDILQRKECCEVMKYESPAATSRSVIRRIELLFYLLENFHETCKDEVIAALIAYQRIVGVGQISRVRDLNSCKFMCIDSDIKPGDAWVLTTMFDLGININSVNIYRKHSSILTHLLANGRMFLKNYKYNRTLLETLICENPDIDLNESAINLALDIDAQWDIEYTSIEMPMVCDYLMDARYHIVVECANDYAFNYISPILIECGFLVKRDLLNRAIDAKTLPSEVLEYFHRHLDKPRPLLLMCRDKLRKNFSGRNLHRFLEYQEIPQKIKSFILIKPGWY